MGQFVFVIFFYGCWRTCLTVTEQFDNPLHTTWNYLFFWIGISFSSTKIDTFTLVFSRNMEETYSGGILDDNSDEWTSDLFGGTPE